MKKQRCRLLILMILLLYAWLLIIPITKPSQEIESTIHSIPTIQEPLIKPLPTQNPLLATNTKIATSPKAPSNPTPKLDIPISKDLQNYIFKLCNKDKDFYCLMVAIMEQESAFNPDIISEDGRDYGLFQIRDINFSWLKEELNIKDCIDPYNNAKCAVHMISKLIDKYEHYNLALMAYNMGEYGAKCKWKQGIYSSSYSRAVLPKYEKYKKQAKEK